MLNIKQKVLQVIRLAGLIGAEREGFEPPVPLSTPVFKTGAIDHSATSPKRRMQLLAIHPSLLYALRGSNPGPID